MADAFSCGYARAAIYHKQGICQNGRKIDNLYERFCSLFENGGISKSTFLKRAKQLQDAFRKWRGDGKKEFLDAFSPAKWDSLSQTEKKKHTVKNCVSCQHNPLNVIFPKHSMNRMTFSHFSHKALSATVSSKANKYFQGTKKELTDAARVIYKTVNKTFLQVFSCNFIDILVKLPELEITKKQSKSAKKAARRNVERRYKKHCEEEMAKTDVQALLGTRQSFRQRQTIRKLMYFESTKDACRRSQKRKLEERSETAQEALYTPQQTRF